jgi:hypothetical protein
MTVLQRYEKARSRKEWKGLLYGPDKFGDNGRTTASGLLLDTKGWILALEGNEEPYTRALAAARPAIVPGLVLAEVDYWFQARRNVMHDVLRDIATGA